MAKFPKKKDYPKEFILNGESYKVKWVSKFKDKLQLAECCPDPREIRLLRGLSREETFACLIHEIIHGLFEFEGNIDIKHKYVYKMDELLLKFLKENGILT